MNQKFKVRGKIWIEGPEGTFLGYGRMVLLERIQKYGSISAAARSMGMSYKHAWDLVDSINRQANIPLVKTSVGGRGGGGAQLTPEGEKWIAHFREFLQALEEFLQEKTRDLEKY